MKLTATKGGVIIEVFVKPGSQKFEVTIEANEIIVRCTEEPVKGKVNKEIIKEFTKLFCKKTEIVSGLTSKQKKLFVADVNKYELEQTLRSK